MQGSFVAVFDEVSGRIINYIFPKLLAELHPFKCFPEHGNSKTVDNRIYERISRMEEVKNMNYK